MNIKKLTKEIADAKEMLNEKLDKEFREMVETELKEAQEKLEVLKKEMKILLLPKDPNDERNVIVEIRGGAGGDEAALLPEICSGCIPGMPREMGGKRKYLIPILRR